MINHILRASLDRNITVSIMYQKGTEITQRNIKVLKINDEDVIAFCFLRNNKRTFKKENILSASFKNKHYERIAK